MKPCPHCGGTGHVRSDSSVALHVVRAIEEFLLKDARNHITVKVPTATALYVLNHKRSTLVEMERRFGVTIALEADETLGAQLYAIFRGAVAEKPVTAHDVQQTPAASVDDEDEIEVDLVEEEEAEPAERQARTDHNGHEEHPNRDRKRRRRRRRRGGGWERDREVEAAGEAGTDTDISNGHETTDGGEESAADESAQPETEDQGEHKKRRRGKRGGRRNRPHEADGEADTDQVLRSEAGYDQASTEPADESEAVSETVEAETSPEAEEASLDAAPEAPPQRAARRARKAETIDEPQAAVAEEAILETLEPEGEESASAANENGGRVHRTRRRPGSDIAANAEPIVVSSAGTADESKPKKAGWWQRKGFF